MATLQLMPVTTINGTTIATAQLILTPVSQEKNQNKKPQSKTILPKQEPSTPPENATPDFSLIRGENPTKIKTDCAKRRIHFSKKALTHPRPQSVTRRNTRERNRVKAVNQGFVTLANHVPPAFRSKKMSKVETLKAAIDYIQKLQAALDSDSPLSSDVMSDDTTSEGSCCQSPTTSTASSHSESMSPCSPSSPVYSSPNSNQSDNRITTPNYYFPAEDTTRSAELPGLPQAYLSSQDTECYQPQLACNKFYDNYNNNNGPALHIDYTQKVSLGHRGVGSCPSPTGSYSSEENRGEITPEVEAELLEFASYFY